MKNLDIRQLVTSITAGLVGVNCDCLLYLIGSFDLQRWDERLCFSWHWLIFVRRICDVRLAENFGTFPGTAIGPQDGPAALVAVAASGIVASIAGTPDSVFSTSVVATIMLCSFATGILIGTFKLGNLVRYIPYPVVGGFLAGTGWLLTRGAIEVMIGQTLSINTLGSLLNPEMLICWLPEMIFALIVLIILRKVNHFWVCWIVFSAIILFYTALFATNTSIDTKPEVWACYYKNSQAEVYGDRSLTTEFHQVQWNVLANNVDKLIPVPLVSLIAFLLNATGLELVAKRDINLNHELRITGIANIASGLGRTGRLSPARRNSFRSTHGSQDFGSSPSPLPFCAAPSY